MARQFKGLVGTACKLKAVYVRLGYKRTPNLAVCSGLFPDGTRPNGTIRQSRRPLHVHIARKAYEHNLKAAPNAVPKHFQSRLPESWWDFVPERDASCLTAKVDVLFPACC